MTVGSSVRGVGGFPRTVDEAMIWCFFVVMLALACTMPMQNDTWWHLRAGQEMWTRHIVMLSDEFSFTVTGADWPNHEWGSEVVFYAVYWLGGLPALTFFAAICVTLALALAWRLMIGTPSQRLLFMGVALTSVVPVWTVRPHVFTLVFLLVVIHLALGKRYWPIPALFLLWANLHGGVALGIVALAGIAAARFFVSGMSQARPILVVFAASFAATCITPIGASLWWTIPESIHKSSVNQIIEWRAASPFGTSYLAFWVTLPLFVATTWFERRRIKTDQHAVLVAVALAVLPLALRSRRNIPPFMLIAIPALTHNLAESLARWTADNNRRQVVQQNPKVNAALIAGCSIVCAALVGAAWSQRAARLQWQPIPQPVIDEVQACGDRVFNRYSDGGPLIWFAPRVRVFIDSRQDPYPLEFTQEYIALEQTGDYVGMFKRYGVTCAMLPETSATARRLTADGWRTRLNAQGWTVLQAVSP